MANETGSFVEEKPVGAALTTGIHSRFVVAGGIKTHFLEAGSGFPAVLHIRCVAGQPRLALPSTRRGTLFDETGACVDGSAKAQLYAVGRQVVEFALQRRGLAMQA